MSAKENQTQQLVDEPFDMKALPCPGPVRIPGQGEQGSGVIAKSVPG